MHSIELTEAIYRRLSEQAARLRLTPEQMIERLLAAPPLAEEEGSSAAPAPGSEEALAAVSRLSGLFAGVTLPDVDGTLADPMIALANADLDDLGR